MITEIPTARPTTYKNVRFRSKSEAVFIRYLELCGYSAWEYEPERFRVENWVPDFWVTRSIISTKSKKQVISSLLIEYKPSLVTDSYKELLGIRFSQIHSQMIQATVATLLMTANAFNPDIPRIAEEFYKGEWLDLPQWSFDRLDEARNWRFDLAL